jgi:hypothetical protein
MAPAEGRSKGIARLDRVSICRAQKEGQTRCRDSKSGQVHLAW